MTDLAIRCSCGALRGTLHRVSAGAGNRVVCECGDCQTFAGALGCAERVLDARGGTDIFQTSPARVELVSGREQLACLRLTAGGLHRWYARCCRSPLGNTLGTPSVPFVGVITACLEPPAGGTLDAALGPVRARVNAPGASRLAALSAVANFVRLLLLARLRGDQRRSPFFDATTGACVVTPHVLAAEELAAARAAVSRETAR